MNESGNANPKQPEKLMDVVLPVVPGLVAFVVATLLVNIYDTN